MQRRTALKSLRDSKLYCTVSSSLIGIIIVIICLLSFSFLMTKIDTPDVIVSFMSSFSLCIGSYFGGYISSKKRRQNGLAMGLLCGVSIYLIVFIAGVIFAKVSVSAGFITKLIMVISCGAIGGVIGVNSKKKRY